MVNSATPTNPSDSLMASHQRPIAPCRFTRRSASVRLFATCWLIYVLHFATNTVREIYPALSLGDHLSFDVSDYAELHPDIFPYQSRWFINNNPGASILGAIPYVLARPVIDRVVERVKHQREASGAKPPPYDSPWPLAREFFRKSYERGFDVKFGLAAAVMQAGLMAPLSALSAVVMFWVLASLTGSTRTGVWLAVLYAVATPVFYRTAQLNQNLLVAHCAWFAFVLLWRPWDDPRSPKRPWYFLAGLLSGWAVVCDYSGVIVPIVMGLYGGWRRTSLTLAAKTRGDALRFTAGVLLSGAVLLGYQWSSFGSPFFPAQHYMPPAHFTEQGYVGMDWPQLDLLWDTAFSKRFGLFTSAPLLLLAWYVPGWVGQRKLLPQRETGCILLFSALFFLFCSANQYGRMQFNTGIRHIVPVTPFLFLLAAGVLLRLPRVVAGLVGLGGVYWSWCLAMYREVEQGPWGVGDAVVHVTLGGFQLPWLTTMKRLGAMLPQGLADHLSPLAILMLLAATIWFLWHVETKQNDRAR